VAAEDDEVYAIASDGVVIRTRVSEIRATGRDTMGVSLMDLSGDNAIVGVARGEATDDEDDDESGADGGDAQADTADANDATAAPVAGSTAPSVTVSDDDQSDPSPDTDSGTEPRTEG
jgi:DNA gyrase subunit A